LYTAIITHPNHSYTPDTSLPEGTYWWRIRGYDESETESCSTAWSDLWKVIIDRIDYPPPDAPTLVYPSCPGTGRQRINDPRFIWTEVADPHTETANAVVYQIQIDRDRSFSIADSEDVDIDTTTTTTSYIPSDLPDGTYFWRVRAIDPSNNNYAGNWSECCSFVLDTTGVKARLIYPGAKAEFCSRQFHINDCTPTLEWVD
ncbi:MAG: hypothetical protein QME81_20485, partial [bacterium]|nr:hypothetical protein [bacterium]